MKILVTGGAGFIGSHLSGLLSDKGHEITVLDRRGDWDNLPAMDAELWHGDCRSFPMNVGKFDFVYHLASTVGVSNVLADPKECIENIVESTRAVLELGIPGIYFSTSEVYGKNTEPLREGSDCVLSGKRRWSYAAAKLCGEWLALAAGWKVVRLFNVIGPNQNHAYGAVVPRFLDCARHGAPIPVHGDGQQKRTFTSVFDVVQVLDILRDKDFDVVNVGSGNTVSILELARTVQQVCYRIQEIDSKGSPIVFRPYREAYADGFEECPSRIPDLGKLYSLIGNFKFRSLHESLKECLNEQEREVRFVEHVSAVHGS